MLSLQKKMQLVLVVTGLIGLGFVAAFSMHSLDLANSSKQQLIESSVASIADKVDRNLFERYGDVQAFALSEPAVSGDPKRITGFMNSMMSTYAPIYDAMLVLDLNGNVIASNTVSKASQPLDNKDLIRQNYKNEVWFKEASSGRIQPAQSFYTDAYLDPVVRDFAKTDGYVMTFSAPIRKKETGEIVGVWANRMSWNDVVIALIDEETKKLLGDRISQTQLSLRSQSGTDLLHEKSAKSIAENTLQADATSKGYSSYPGAKWHFTLKVPQADHILKYVIAMIATAVAIMLLVNVCGGLMIRSIVRKLETAIANLSNGYQQVSSTSGDLNGSAMSLAQASTQQASALQETAASIEEINAMIKKSSENAALSKDAAGDAATLAKEGKNAVEQMTIAMQDISTSNSEMFSEIRSSNAKLSEIVKLIGEIELKTKIINDIVFQTKLLSFNASVEAARAGEHGKGFAVVAEEVGNLAELSGRSSREISDILNTSTSTVEAIVGETQRMVDKLLERSRSKIDSGLVLATGCETTLNDVVNRVEQLQRMVREISIATEEQSQGVNEITRAMAELDHVTNENASTSQNVSKYAGGLREESESLHNVVGDLVQITQGRSA